MKIAKSTASVWLKNLKLSNKAKEILLESRLRAALYCDKKLFMQFMSEIDIIQLKLNVSQGG